MNFTFNKMQLKRQSFAILVACLLCVHKRRADNYQSDEWMKHDSRVTAHDKRDLLRSQSLRIYTFSILNSAPSPPVALTRFSHFYDFFSSFQDQKIKFHSFLSCREANTWRWKDNYWSKLALNRQSSRSSQPLPTTHRSWSQQATPCKGTWTKTAKFEFAAILCAALVGGSTASTRTSNPTTWWSSATTSRTTNVLASIASKNFSELQFL